MTSFGSSSSSGGTFESHFHSGLVSVSTRGNYFGNSKGLAQGIDYIRNMGNESPKPKEVARRLSSRFDAAQARLRVLTNPEFQSRLSTEDIARINNLMLSCLASNTVLAAAVPLITRKRKLDTQAMYCVVDVRLHLQDLETHIEIEEERLQSLLRAYDFDGELRESTVYARAVVNDVGTTTAGRLRASLLRVVPSGSSIATALQSDGPRESVPTQSSFDKAEIRSITTSFAADDQSLEGDRWATAVNKSVHLTDDHGESQLLSALLDTGANRNFISEAKVAMLRLEAATRKLRQPKQISAANGSITVLHMVKVNWRFINETESYSHKFYVVPGLEHDIIIGRNFIFEHGLLMNNVELCSLSPPDEDESVPELLILGVAKLSKAEKKDQDERTTAKERENQVQRDKEATEIRTRLATLASSSNASANAGVAASSSGLSNKTT